jgi:hypothetical protein
MFTEQVTFSTLELGVLTQTLQMIIAGEEFVAKALVDVGRGHGDVSLDEAVRLLSADLVRLKWMEFFAKAFFARVAHEGAEITCAISSFLVLL